MMAISRRAGAIGVVGPGVGAGQGRREFTTSHRMILQHTSAALVAHQCAPAHPLGITELGTAKLNLVALEFVFESST